MSVRRLADEAVQPESFAFSRTNAAWAKKKLKDFPKGREASAVIPLLMRVQEQEGWVTKPAIEHVADMLDMPLIRVLEVATFYTQFQLAPVGRAAHVQVCGTTPCMLRGSDELIAVCKRRISPNQFELSPDGKLSWEEVECQGACVNAPMVMVFKDTYEDLTPGRLEEIIDQFEAGDGASVATGPQIDRIFSAPEGGQTTLNDNPEQNSRPARSSGSRAEEQLPTDAARPASHVEPVSQAVKSPVSVEKAKKAKAEKQEARAEAGTASPKKRAKKLAANAEKPVSPADMRQPKPRALKADRPAAAQALSEANRPVAIEEPAEIDDLKLINGIGPKIESILHGLGIYTFAQIAKWKKAERVWVDGYLRFGGRIERDDWVHQAKALAKGERREPARPAGKEPR